MDPFNTLDRKFVGRKLKGEIVKYKKRPESRQRWCQRHPPFKGCHDLEMALNLIILLQEEKVVLGLPLL